VECPVELIWDSVPLSIHASEAYRVHTADGPASPRCGGYFKRSPNYSQGMSDDGATRQAMACLSEAHSLRRSSDGSWIAPLMPQGGGDA